MLAGFQQPLRERASGAVGALDGPDPLRPAMSASIPSMRASIWASRNR
ncbi:MAG: hypothetical protein ACR2JU_09360 [Nocardioidaceae bacterium]